MRPETGNRPFWLIGKKQAAARFVVAGSLFLALTGAFCFSAPSWASDQEAFPLPVFPEEGWTTPEDYFEKTVAPVIQTELSAQEADLSVNAQENIQALKEAPEILFPEMPGNVGWRRLEETPTLAQNGDDTDDEPRWKNWEEMKAFMEEQEKKRLADKEGKIDVKRLRFAFNPSPDIQSIPDLRISKPKLGKEPQRAAKKKKPLPPEEIVAREKSAAPNEACDMLEKTRQKQLEAVESDRRTLVALREAMKELGLFDKLSFLIDGATSVPTIAGVEGVLPSKENRTAIR